MYGTPNMEQGAMVQSIAKFARNELAPGARERAHARGYPWDVARRMAEMGLLGITFPEADGGLGGSLMDAVLAIQTVAEHCPKSADVVQAGNFGPIRTFVEYASPTQKERWLGRLLRGDMLISLGMSEPDAGSAVTELATSAREDGQHYVINGSKVFSTHSAEADLFLIYARFGPGAGGIGSVLIERGTPGFTIGERSSFMSGEEWCPLYFEDVRIPRENVLLGPGGFKKQLSGFNVERLGNAARAGLGPLCLRGCAGPCAGPPPVRPQPERIPGPAMEIRRHADEARSGADVPSPGRRRSERNPAFGA